MINVNYTNFNTATKAYQAARSAAKTAASKIALAIEEDHNSYKIFCMNSARKQITDCKGIVDKIRNNFTDLIVIGMGGSVLNPETLINLNSNSINSPTRIHFLNNTDPIYFRKLLSTIEIINCAVLTISNSGTTLETNSLVGAMISEFEKNNIDSIGTRFFFITKPDSGILSEIAGRISGNLIEHTPNISGRFSGLTNVTTLIAAIAGVRVEDYIAGAEEVIQDFLLNPESNEAVLSATAIFSTNKPIMVNIGYLQQFSSYLEWYSQIIAESLGKDGGGITPLRGLGPNDQHSMLQLYLDGPQDKIYTLFYVQNLKDTTKICSFEELGYIAEKYLSDINTANFLATKSALSTNNLPIRTILLQDLSSRSIGSLVAHSMLETIMLSHMMNLNPFNQPGVELIKTKSKQLIAGASL